MLVSHERRGQSMVYLAVTDQFQCVSEGSATQVGHWWSAGTESKLEDASIVHLLQEKETGCFVTTAE